MNYGKEEENKDEIIIEGIRIKGTSYNKKDKIIHISDIIYKGEFKNRKRHGKGKEFKDNILIFEGEYLNGKRNGK